jgi:hypothetical protein
MTHYGPVECSPKQCRVDGCQLRSGRGSRANTSGKSRPKTEHWPSSLIISTTRAKRGGVARTIATLKVGGGSGAGPPSLSTAQHPPRSGRAGCRQCLIACNMRQPDARSHFTALGGFRL